MPKTIIEQFTTRDCNLIKYGVEDEAAFNASTDKTKSLEVAECFGDTIQGEGIFVGHPATFLRLKGCTLDCTWCDTASVWRKGDRYDLRDIVELMEKSGLIDQMKDNGQHLILTGGSPLKQQDALINLLRRIELIYGFKPYVEVENECVLMPDEAFIPLVDCWNNSPKLANSGMKKRARYKPEVIEATARLKNSWFKFVVSSEEDWNEIEQDYLNQGLIRIDQIILMPCGEDQLQLSATREIAADMAVKYGVRFSDRLHITIWNCKTGV